MSRHRSIHTAVIAVCTIAGLMMNSAAGDNRGDFIHWRVFIDSPSFDELRVYSPGGQIPPWIPIFTQVNVDDGLPVRGQDGPPELLTTLGGDLDLSGDAPTVVGALDTVEPTLVDATPLSGAFFWSVHNAANMNFEESTERGVTRLVADDMLRAVLTASTYYNGELFGVAEKPLSVEILDADDVDEDGNGIPNATALALEPSLLIANGRSGISSSTSIGEKRIVQDGTFVSLSFESIDGPVEVSVAAPTLEELRNADPAAYSDVFDARLLVSIESNAANLVDTPGNTNPIGEFNLSDGSGPLPPPRNLFIRVILLVLRNSGGLPWDAVETLPGNLRTQVRISGPGVRPLLESEPTVAGYTYDVSTRQNQEDIIAIKGNAGWNEVESLVLLDNHIAIEDEDTIEMRSREASAIFGTNAMPQRIDDENSGGGGGGCFIATAAYGTPMAAEIQTLREVRDGYLVNSTLGAAFVDVYYRLSPAVAGVIAQNETAKQIVRASLVPVIAVSERFVAAPGLVAAAALLALVAMAGLGRRYGSRVK